CDSSDGLGFQRLHVDLPRDQLGEEEVAGHSEVSVPKDHIMNLVDKIAAEALRPGEKVRWGQYHRILDEDLPVCSWHLRPLRCLRGVRNECLARYACEHKHAVPVGPRNDHNGIRGTNPVDRSDPHLVEVRPDLTEENLPFAE